LAVGDDDQNIYTFRGANVRFIRRFQEDYHAKIIYLVENYRSSKHIIAASNALIHNNRDRMKGAHPICINREREPNLPGGRWGQLDPVSQGRVQIVSVKNPLHQAGYIKSEIDRIMRLDSGVNWSDFAILSRTKAPLAAVRSVLEIAGYPQKTTLDEGLPLHRVREIQVALEWLMVKEKENSRASDLQAGLSEVRGEKESNIWWQLIDMFLESYREETADSVLPASWMIDRLFEFVAEQRREKVVGQGIFMSTIHSAKGTEFPHVFVLDGDWRQSMDEARWEEERRIMYVGMTRAEETLCLLKIPGRTNPFLKEIKGDFVIPLTYRRMVEAGEHIDKKYELLGLNQIYLDYAGCFPQTHPIHGHLAELGTGQCVFFYQNNSIIEIHDRGGNCLARLSSEGSSKWQKRLDHILEVRVVAMLRRNRDDPDENFQKKIRADNWELPVLEVVSPVRAGGFNR
jgi:ATP-dependent DNA helicase RecQ